MLVGRDAEIGVLERLLADARLSSGGVLVLRGEAGIGKTALLTQARTVAGDATVIGTAGVESEVELAFSGLGDVLRPLVAKLGALSERQREIVEAALGLVSPRALDRLEIGAATLSLLAAAAAERPVVVLVDDAHWLDAASADALVFAARRLGSDPVAVVFAAREGEPRRFEAAGLPDLVIGGLARDDARTLLGARVPSNQVADELIDETGGNPLALLELPGALGEAQLAGDEPLERPLRIAAAIERSFTRRVLMLGDDVRQAVLVAAADETEQASVVSGAIEVRGLPADALDRAEDAGLLRIDQGRLAFRHPLVRSAVYHGAAPSERRAAHAALARVLEGVDDDRHAWHLAASVAGDDPVAAGAVEGVAERARARGAYEAASVAFERAARVGPPGVDRARRLAAAADTALVAAKPDRTLALVGEGLSGDPDREARADLLAVRARLAFAVEDQALAFDACTAAADLVASDDPRRAAELLGDAVDVGLHLGGAAVARAEQMLRALPLTDDPIAEFLRERALGNASGTRGGVEAFEHLDRAMEAIEGEAIPLDSPTLLYAAGRTCFSAGRYALAVELARRLLESGRAGATWLVAPALRLVAQSELFRGRWREAYAAAGEAVREAEEVGQRMTSCASLWVLAEIDAAAGNESACKEHAVASIAIADELGLGYFRERSERTLGRLDLVLGRVEEARSRLWQSWDRLHEAANREFNVSPAYDLIDIETRLGETDRAQALLEQAFAEMPLLEPSEKALAERCRGLVADDFRPHFERALNWYDTAEAEGHFLPYERARTELCYGERLRRDGARREARVHLHAALEQFDALGAAAWSTRADAELRATGERRRPAATAREHLSPREMQIALAVAEGRSNKEVAATLFVTPKTVEYHLTRIYRKAGVRSRAELVLAFNRPGSRPPV